MNTSLIYIIVPAYNEQSVLRRTVEELLYSYKQIVIVDDGSLTLQSDVLVGLPVTIIRHQQNLGQGAALQTGNEYALRKGANFIVHFDADGQHQVSDIKNLIDPLVHDDADIVFGSRFLDTHTKPPVFRKILLQCARYINFLYSGCLLTDAHNGLRAMNRKAAMLLQIRENRMAHASAILLSAKRQSLRLTEIPVTILYNVYTLNKGQSGWNSIRIVFDLLLHKLLK